MKNPLLGPKPNKTQPRVYSICMEAEAVLVAAERENARLQDDVAALTAKLSAAAAAAADSERRGTSVSAEIGEVRAALADVQAENGELNRAKRGADTERADVRRKERRGEWLWPMVMGHGGMLGFSAARYSQRK